MAKKTKKRTVSSGTPKVVLTKTSDNSKKKKDAKKIIIGVISYILLTFILLFSQYSELLGTPGEFIKNFLLGLFGSVSLAFPFIMIYDFFQHFKQKKNSGSKTKIIASIIIIFNMAAIFHMTSSGKAKTGFNIEKLYTGGIDGTHTGGIFGGFFGEIFKYIGYYFGITLLFIMLAALSFIILYEPAVALYKFIVKYCAGLEKPEIERKPKEKKKPVENTAADGSDFDKIMDVHNEYSDVDEKKPQNAGNKNGVTDAEQHVIDEKDRLDKILMGIEQKELPPTAEEEPQAPEDKEMKEPAFSNTGEEAPAKTENDEIILPDNKLIEYKFPTTELLDDSKTDYKKTARDIGKLKENAGRLEEILRSFGVKAEVVNIERGPTITRYELQPASGVRVTKIMSLQDDIKMNLAATSIRIAPIPGKTVIGVEVPNETITPVVLKDLISSDKFRTHKSKLAFTVGMDITGNPVIGDISKMPHVLIAGATGSGKSVCINCIITSILYKANPNEVKLIMVDPKVVELSVYNGIPHLLLPVVTDPKKATGALNWAVMEMENRYRIFAEYGVRNIQGYNEYIQKKGEADSFMPQIVIIIDELSDLMMVSPKDVEKYICRLAQLARAAGIHLVIATQRPSVNVITGLIKANVPSRIAFAVSSFIDSKTILDMGGAEKLLGKGDMLYHPMGEPKPIRIQGAYVSDKEVERVVNVIKANSTAAYDEDIMEHLDNFQNEEDAPAERQDNAGDADALLPQAIETVLESGQASTSFLQRRLGLGYARAAKIIDQMEARGIVGPSAGSKPREILITKEQFYEMQMKGQ